ncbi:uncharacterized protein LOC106151095 [Lingula anatina]|uniref:Uncharacterized protein LOC106151095 n=1 Tax=Lingula anatina TaxID=7574 RepID=A0A1S3H2D7_LINAN|nr:uncharacterized protein LOC106151095 [Lingula anatina]|eukprot:XP_013379641.1 uncharacterized protein LOC106151095 [Lingula anatina]
MENCEKELFYPVLPPNKDAVCDSNMTGSGNGGVARFILKKKDYGHLIGKRRKDDRSNFGLKELHIQTFGIKSLPDLKNIIGDYIKQHKACLVDGVNDFNINLVLEREWEELINKLELENDDVIDLRLFHIAKENHNFFMLAKNVSFLLLSADTAPPPVPLVVFLLHSVKPQVEKFAKIFFKSWGSFERNCREYHDVVRGHIFNCLVALSNGDHSYEDKDGNTNRLTDSSSWEIKDTEDYDSDESVLGSGYKKTSKRLCHISIKGTTTDCRLVFWEQKYNQTERVYLIDKIAQHSKGGMVKNKGDKHSKEKRTRKRTASDDNPEELEREINKIKVVFCHNKQADENKASKATTE